MVVDLVNYCLVNLVQDPERLEVKAEREDRALVIKVRCAPEDAGRIIGRGGRHIAEQDALRHVFGYTVLNDVTARDLQMRHKQFFLGKSLDGSCPMGPALVTADEIADVQNLTLRCWVNGVLKQEGNTADQIFNVARTIAILSRSMTLEPGDIIATGTPDGVGFARKPPEFLAAGDVLESEIEGLGRLRNRIVAA